MNTAPILTRRFRTMILDSAVGPNGICPSKRGNGRYGQNGHNLSGEPSPCPHRPQGPHRPPFRKAPSILTAVFGMPGSQRPPEVPIITTSGWVDEFSPKPPLSAKEEAVRSAVMRHEHDTHNGRTRFHRSEGDKPPRRTGPGSCYRDPDPGGQVTANGQR